jgi:hypothetical protein
VATTLVIGAQMREMLTWELIIVRYAVAAIPCPVQGGIPIGDNPIFIKEGRYQILNFIRNSNRKILTVKGARRQTITFERLPKKNKNRKLFKAVAKIQND